MTLKQFPALVDLQASGWDADRVAAALATAAPNDERIAQAALRLLDSQDHIDSFGQWCDAQALAGKEAL